MTSIAHILDPNDLVTIADIGASLTGDGKTIYQDLLDSRKARLIAFEPDLSALTALRERYGPPHLCLPHFVGNGKSATFHETNWGPTGSLFEPNLPLLEKFHHLAEITRVVRTLPVDTVRLDDIPEIADVDFIKIDVQGAELMIFENAQRILSEVTLIQTEVNFVEMYKGMPLAADVDRMLRSLGFEWHFRFGSGYRSFLPFLNPENPHSAFNQELWGDVVYVRSWMKFDEIPARKLLKLAVLLNDLYGSYDLAHLAMAAVDRKLGTNYSENYAKWLSE
jgi:FkbM family methyltransferase